MQCHYLHTHRSPLLVIFFYVFSNFSSWATLCDYDPDTRCLNPCFLSPFYIRTDRGMSPWADTEGEGQMREKERCSNSQKRKNGSEVKLVK